MKKINLGDLPILQKLNKLCLPRNQFQQSDSFELDETERRSIPMFVLPAPASIPKTPILQQQPMPDLHQLVFQGNYLSLKQSCKSRQSEFECKDSEGNTPFMLAVKLSLNSKVHTKIAKLLAKRGSDVSAKDSKGWSVMDHAVLMKNRELVGFIFDVLYQQKMTNWVRNNLTRQHVLESLPNFYLEIKWKFVSKYIPLVSKIAPKDTIKIWKLGTSLRVDTTLVGWKNLKSKRRHMTLFLVEGGTFRIANHSKKVIFDPLQSPDQEERQAVITDLIEVEPIQGGLAMKSYSVEPLLNWRHRPVYCRVNKLDCQVFKVNVNTRVSWKKASESRGRSLVKATEAKLWVTNEFPLSIKDTLVILDVLRTMNNSLRKFVDFISNRSIFDNLPETGFPVKLDIPLNFSIRAQISFKTCEFNPRTAPITLPQYPLVPRKEAQKTMSCPKKRLLLANIVV